MSPPKALWWLSKDQTRDYLFDGDQTALNKACRSGGMGLVSLQIITRKFCTVTGTKRYNQPFYMQLLSVTDASSQPLPFTHADQLELVRCLNLLSYEEKEGAICCQSFDARHSAVQPLYRALAHTYGNYPPTAPHMPQTAAELKNFAESLIKRGLFMPSKVKRPAPDSGSSGRDKRRSSGSSGGVQLRADPMNLDRGSTQGGAAAAAPLKGTEPNKEIVPAARAPIRMGR